MSSRARRDTPPPLPPMLQFLPVEILQDILHQTLFPVNCQGYYLDLDEGRQWAQKDGLNLSATCRALRRALTPILWQHLHLDITGNEPRKLPWGYRLFSKSARPGSSDGAGAVSFLNCLWGDKVVKYNVSGRDRCVPLVIDFVKNPTSMDLVLSHVKVFKIRCNSELAGCEGGYTYYTEALTSYLVVICMVNPEMMPVLETLILDVFLDERTNKAHTNLGRLLKTFKNKINLSVTAMARRYWTQTCDSIFDIDLLSRFGLLPFVVNLEVPFIDCTERGGSQLTNLRGLAFSNSPRKIQLYPSFMADSSITYLDVRSVADVRRSQFD